MKYLQVKLRDGCPLPTIDIFLSMYCPEAKLWSSYCVGQMQSFTQMLGVNASYVNIVDD